MVLRVLLAGATGSIGSVLLRALIAQGHEVTAVVIEEEMGERLVAVYGSQCRYAVLYMTPTSGQELQALATGYDCTIQAMQTSFEVEEVACKAFLAAAEATSAAGRRTHFIYISGSLMYGDCGDEVISEAHSTSNCFELDRPKLQFEREVLAAGNDLAVTTVLRCGWVYPGSYISEYLRKTRSLGFVLSPSRNGYLCVLHTEDLCQLFLQVVESRKGGLYNVAETTPVTAHEFTESVAAALSLRVEKVENVVQWVSSVGYFAIALGTSQRLECRAERELQWRPRSIMRELEGLIRELK